MGFNSIDSFINGVTAGKFWRNDWIKLYNGSATATVGNWYDLSQGAGNPIQYMHGNLVTNYDFMTSMLPWVIGTSNWAYTPGTHLMTRSANADVSTLSQTLRVTAGQPYMVTYTLGWTAGTCTVSLGGTSGTGRGSSSTFREVIVCGTTNKDIAFTPNATGNFTVDLVSVEPAFGYFLPYNDLTEGCLWHGGDTPAGNTKHLVNIGAFTNAAAGVPSILELVDVLGVYPHMKTDSAAIQACYGADAYTANIVNDCQLDWNEQTPANTAHSLVVKATEGVTGASVNAKCVKLQVTTSGAFTGIVASRVVALATTAYNFLYAKYIYAWVRSTINLNAGDISFCTDESTNLASSQDTVLPALTANTWTRVRLDVSGMTGTDKDTIISIGMKVVNSKAQTFSVYWDYVSWAVWDGNLYNGTFTGNANGWTMGTSNWAYRSNDVERTANADCSTMSQTLLPVVQKCQYRVTFTIANRSAGTVTVNLGGGTPSAARSTDGTYEEIVTCGTTDYSLYFTPDAAFNGRISHVICTSLIPRADADTLPTTYGGGVRMYYVLDGTATNGGTASTVVIKYTNQAAVKDRYLGATVNQMTSDTTYHLPHSGVGAGKFAPFLPMQSGDYGIQQVDSYQQSAAQATADGAVSILVCKPITSIPITTVYVEAERDLMNQLPSLPRVRDGACLMFLIHTGGATVAGSAFMGYCEFAYS